jgi:hypothetical protein
MAHKAILELNGLAAVGGRLKVTYDLASTEAQGQTLGASAYRSGPLFYGDGNSANSAARQATPDADVFGPVGGYGQSSGMSTPIREAIARTSTFQKHHSMPHYNSPSSAYNTPGFSGYGTPPHLAAMGRRLSEPGMLQGLVNQADISARAKLGQGIGGVPRNPSQAIPEQNRVFPERILSGRLRMIDF